MRVSRSLGCFVASAVVLSAGTAACSSPHRTPSAVVRTPARRRRTRTHIVPVAPLTGLPDPKDVARRRPAVTVKINNTSAAKQYGIDQADDVYEEVVEGGITRLAAIFNSQAPDRVGPVRSVRKTDQSLVWPIGGIFAYSGGAAYAIASIDTAPVKQLDETRAGSMMYRDQSGYAPYNLFAHVDQMFNAGGTPVPPPPLFEYRPARAAITGTRAAAFTVGFAAGYAVTWAWDAKSQSWLRSKFGAPDIAGDGARVRAKNVVVMFVQYLGGAGVEQSEAQLIGAGPAWVFTDGKLIKGQWHRTDQRRPATLVDAHGHPIRLTPGQTWVELPDVSYSVAVLSAR
jgi:hypothetical protein